MEELLKRLEDGLEEFFEEFEKIPVEELVKEMEELGIMFSEEDHTDTVKNVFFHRCPSIIFENSVDNDFDVLYSSELLCCA